MSLPAGNAKKAAAHSYLPVLTSTARRSFAQPVPTIHPRRTGLTSWCTILGCRCLRPWISTTKTSLEPPNLDTSKMSKSSCRTCTTRALSTRVPMKETTALAAKSSKRIRIWSRVKAPLLRNLFAQSTQSQLSVLRKPTTSLSSANSSSLCLITMSKTQTSFSQNQQEMKLSLL